MRHVSVLVFALSAALAGACSHSAPTPSTTPLPGDPAAGAGSEDLDAVGSGSGSGSATVAVTPPKPTPPPPPAKAPHDTTVAAMQPTVKLLSSGTGKKQRLSIAGVTGAKQPVDVTLGLGLKQPGRDHSMVDQTLPAVVLHGDAEIIDAGASGTTYKLVVSKVDAKDVPGETRPPAFDDTIAGLATMSITSQVAANGAVGATTIHHDAADVPAIALMEQLVAPGLLPTWPVLPPDAVGVGAKWESTVQFRLRQELVFTEILDYELVSVAAKGFVIKAIGRIEGQPQVVDGAKIDNILGTAAFTCTMTGGLFGVAHADLKLDFNAVVPSGPNGATETAAFEFRFATDVAPRS